MKLEIKQIMSLLTSGTLAACEVDRLEDRLLRLTLATLSAEVSA